MLTSLKMFISIGWEQTQPTLTELITYKLTGISDKKKQEKNSSGAEILLFKRFNSKFSNMKLVIVHLVEAIQNLTIKEKLRNHDKTRYSFDKEKMRAVSEQLESVIFKSREGDFCICSCTLLTRTQVTTQYSYTKIRQPEI